LLLAAGFVSFFLRKLGPSKSWHQYRFWGFALFIL